MVTKPTGNPRGRPDGTTTDWLNNPDRFAIILSLAAEQVFKLDNPRAKGISREAMRLGETIAKGKMIDPPGTAASFLMLKRDGRLFKKAEVRLRQTFCQTKRDKIGYSPQESAWLEDMFYACIFALRPPHQIPLPAVITYIEMLAAKRSETAFAGRVLIPIARQQGLTGPAIRSAIERANVDAIRRRAKFSGPC
jgi:hypothetical protein